MSVWLYVCMYLCICMYVRRYVWMDICLHVCNNRFTHTLLHRVVEAMFSYEVMFSVHGDVIFADRAERIAYNALPATWASPANTGDMWYVLTRQQLSMSMHTHRSQSTSTTCFHFFRPSSSVISYCIQAHWRCCCLHFLSFFPCVDLVDGL